MSGEIVPQGAKNEALEVICATLLTPEKVTIHNVPDILDVNNLIQLLRDMRVKVERYLYLSGGRRGHGVFTYRGVPAQEW